MGPWNVLRCVLSCTYDTYNITSETLIMQSNRRRGYRLLLLLWALGLRLCLLDLNPYGSSCDVILSRGVL